MERGAVIIRFLAPFGGKDNWEIKVPIQSGETLGDVFLRLPQVICEEIQEKILKPDHPRFGVAVNGIMIPQMDLLKTPLKGGEKITLLARLVGG